MRKVLKEKTDKRIFRNTASTGKAINLGKVIYRGGIRF